MFTFNPLNSSPLVHQLLLKFVFKDEIGALRERVVSANGLFALETALKYELEVTRPLNDWSEGIKGPVGLWFRVQAFMGEVETPVGKTCCLCVSLSGPLAYPADTLCAIEDLALRACAVIDDTIPHHFARASKEAHSVARWDASAGMEKVAA